MILILITRTNLAFLDKYLDIEWNPNLAKKSPPFSVKTMCQSQNFVENLTWSGCDVIGVTEDGLASISSKYATFTNKRKPF